MAARVLLADDELHILRAAEFKLKRQGYEVFCACDGQAAWDMIHHVKPDILITDQQMPRMCGTELVARLRDDPQYGNLPAILLTAKGFELSKKDTMETLGVLDIVAKPFSPRDLCNRVEAALKAGTPEDDLVSAAADIVTPMNLPTEIFGDVIVAHAPDELHEDSAERFEHFLLTLDRSQVAVDLDGVESIDSGGLTALLDAQDRLRTSGGDLKIISSNHVNRKILEITRLDQQLEVFDSVIDAVKSFA